MLRTLRGRLPAMPIAPWLLLLVLALWTGWAMGAGAADRPLELRRGTATAAWRCTARVAVRRRARACRRRDHV